MAKEKAVIEDDIFATAASDAAETTVEVDGDAFTDDDTPQGPDSSDQAEPEETIKTDRIFRHLECRLTNDEKIERGEENARAVKELARVQAEKKEVANRYKAQEEKLSNDIARLSNIVDTGREYRSVECERVVDYKGNCVTETRLDTWAIVSTRRLNDDEAQIAMDLIGEDK